MVTLSRTYGLDPQQLLAQVIMPALVIAHIEPLTTTAELVLGTAMHESQLRFLYQVGGGPALGLWQMEPATHDDIFSNYLRYDAGLRDCISLHYPRWRGADLLASDLCYAATMCAVHYKRHMKTVPAVAAPERLAEWWKKYYNTEAGKGTVEQCLPCMRDAVAVVAAVS